MSAALTYGSDGPTSEQTNANDESARSEAAKLVIVTLERRCCNSSPIQTARAIAVTPAVSPA
jgi:hypothetical protein